MTMEVDLFWSFRSPYSYLGMPRYREMEREHDLKINVRPVYPIAIRTPEFFSEVNPLWPRYLMRDVFRVADYLELPFSWPEPDPVVMDMPTRTIPKEQPYIHRLTRLGIEAVNRGAGLAFISEVSDLLWGRAVKQWHEGDHLARATARAMSLSTPQKKSTPTGSRAGPPASGCRSPRCPRRSPTGNRRWRRANGRGPSPMR